MEVIGQIYSQNMLIQGSNLSIYFRLLLFWMILHEILVILRNIMGRRHIGYRFFMNRSPL